MKRSNLFLRLEGYSRENFTTEILAYLLESDAGLRDAFLALILQGEHWRLRTTFHDCSVITQSQHLMGRPDIELLSKQNHARLFVEVKTGAPETNGQVGRYLKVRSAHTALLTPLGDEYSEKYDKQQAGFLGQYYWPDVYRLIQCSRSNNVIKQQFLKYLEGHHMGPVKPFTTSELNSGIRVSALLAKSEALVTHVRDEIEKEWTRSFGRNTGAKTLTKDFAHGEFCLWWFRIKRWKASKRSFYLSFGVGLDTTERPAFYVNIGSARKQFWREIDSALKVRFAKLGHRWVAIDPSEDEFGYTRFYPLKPTRDISHLAKEHIRNVRKATEELQKHGILKALEESL